MGDSPRLEALRRRVLADPASIAFAALAEEYRRAGRFDAAIETARAGLERHPAYASARVTLGRALLESGATEAARLELEQALAAAPENLAGLRALVDLYRSTGAAERARELAKRGAALASQDRDWRAVLDALEDERRAGPPNVIPFHLNGRAATGGNDEPPTEAATPPPVTGDPGGASPAVPPADGAERPQVTAPATEDVVHPPESAVADWSAAPQMTSAPGPLVAVGADGEPLGVFGPPKMAVASGAGPDGAVDEPAPFSGVGKEVEFEAVAMDVGDVAPEALPFGTLVALPVEIAAPPALAGEAPIELPLHEPDPWPVAAELGDLASRSFVEPDVVASPAPSSPDASAERSAQSALAPLEQWLEAIVREQRRRQGQQS